MVPTRDDAYMYSYLIPLSANNSNGGVPCITPPDKQYVRNFNGNILIRVRKFSNSNILVRVRGNFLP